MVQEESDIIAVFDEMLQIIKQHNLLKDHLDTVYTYAQPTLTLLYQHATARTLRRALNLPFAGSIDVSTTMQRFYVSRLFYDLHITLDTLQKHVQ